jgi:hypothetical protein
MELELAEGVLRQFALEIITRWTTSPFCNVLLEKVLPVPAFVLLSVHWYEGAGPPLVTFAVNVTLVPAQIVPGGPAVMLTAGVKIGQTVIVIKLETSWRVVAHGAFDVSTTFTTSPVCNVELEKTGAFEPVLMPFTCH